MGTFSDFFNFQNSTRLLMTAKVTLITSILLIISNGFAGIGAIFFENMRIATGLVFESPSFVERIVMYTQGNLSYFFILLFTKGVLFAISSSLIMSGQYWVITLLAIEAVGAIIGILLMFIPIAVDNYSKGGSIVYSLLVGFFTILLIAPFVVLVLFILKYKDQKT